MIMMEYAIAGVRDGSFGRIIEMKMDDLIMRARKAATFGTGGGDGSPYREGFSSEIYKATLEALIANERASAGMTIAQAIEKIRNAESLKDRHRTIDMEIVIHDESVDVSFGVWAGNKGYKGATLEGAVNSCLVSNNEFSGTEEEAERVIQEALEVSADQHDVVGEKAARAF